MKKLFSLVITFGAFQVSAQVSTMPHSIGIGLNPNPAIPLHIKKSGNVMSIDGTSNPYITFLNDGNYGGYIQVSDIGLTIGTPFNTKLLEFRTDSQVRMTIDASSGQVSTYYRLNATAGINNIGAMRMAGNAGNVGDVLMSMGNTTPVWSSITQNPQIGFQAKLTVGTLIIPHSTNVLLTNYNENWDDGNNFDPITGTFTVPSAGLYHFEYNFSIDLIGTNPEINNGFCRIGYKINTLAPSYTDKYVFKASGVASNQSIKGTQSLKLNQGDQIKFQISQTNEHSQSVQLFTNNSSEDPIFRCYKIY